MGDEDFGKMSEFYQIFLQHFWTGVGFLKPGRKMTKDDQKRMGKGKWQSTPALWKTLMLILENAISSQNKT